MKTALNLLPMRYRRERLMRRRAIQWSIVLVAALATIGAARWYRTHEYRSLERQLAAVSREGSPAQTMLREITKMRDEIAQLQQHQTIATELEQQRQVLALLAVVSRSAHETQGRLRVTDCRVIDLQATEVAANQSNNASHEGTVTLVGVSLDSPTVAEFHDGLVRSGLFADVKLIKSNERAEVGTELYDYEVRCEL
jgi:Tfp pilus assembly protein PilN